MQGAPSENGPIFLFFVFDDLAGTSRLDVIFTFCRADDTRWSPDVSYDRRRRRKLLGDLPRT